MDTKRKCRHLKIWPVKGLCGRCLSVWGPLLSQVFVSGGLAILQVLNLVRYWVLSDSATRFSISAFFSRISFPQAPEYTIRAILNFSKKFADIFATQGAQPVSLTPVAYGINLQSEKFFIILLGHFWEAEFTYRTV